jgi:tetratricopeptide (TPR) repeat protein
VTSAGILRWVADVARAGLVRRLTVASISLLLAVVLFHGNVASALVTRGDAVLRAGDVEGAVRYYARAARLDAGSRVAADRLAFFLLMRRRPGDAARAYAIADAVLRARPAGFGRDDAAGISALLADRALAALRLSHVRAAERDFAAAAATAGDPRYAFLAAHAAARRGDRAAAREHLRAALRFDASYAPARALIARLGS